MHKGNLAISEARRHGRNLEKSLSSMPHSKSTFIIDQKKLIIGFFLD